MGLSLSLYVRPSRHLFAVARLSADIRRLVATGKVVSPAAGRVVESRADDCRSGVLSRTDSKLQLRRKYQRIALGLLAHPAVAAGARSRTRPMGPPARGSDRQRCSSGGLGLLGDVSARQSVA